jgi:Tfp pilus assembly protein PilX
MSGPYGSRARQSPRRHDTRTGAALVDGVALLVVVAILAVGAGLLVHRARERAIIATMTSDLQRLALHQESSRRDEASYSPDVSVVEARGFQGSEGVRIDVREATNRGWSAVACHRATAVHCYLFVGEAAPLGVALQAGTVRCA